MKNRHHSTWTLAPMTLIAAVLCVSIFSSFRSYSEDDFMLLVVDKANLKANLQTLPPVGQQPHTLKSFTIATGKVQGDKIHEGDQKTPEGIYFALNRLDPAQLNPVKHGPGGIAIDYPNPMDQMEGKTGYGIWLHGAGNDDRIAGATVTEGCVAFYNADILKLVHWLSSGQSVVIANGKDRVNQPDDVQAVHSATLAWIQDWNNRNLEQYGRHYAPQFANDGRNKSAYIAYKRRVFGQYRVMNVHMADIRVITHPKYAASLMNQDFRGDRFVTKGRKVVYWRKTGDSWTIVNEHFDRRPFTPLRYTMQEAKNLNLITDQAKDPNSSSAVLSLPKSNF